MAWIARRADRWQVGWRDPSGRKRYRTFPRQRDAIRFKREVESSVDRGRYIDPAAGRVPLGAYADAWLAGLAHLRPSTRDRYASLLRVHVLPALGDVPLSRIRAADIRGLVSSMVAAGLAPKTVRHAYTLLLGMLRTAAEDNLIPAVPTPGREARRVLPRIARTEQRYLTSQEVAQLASVAPLSSRYRAFVYLGAYGALRWGELAGLRVTRLRLLERKVDIVETPEGEPKWGAAGTVTIPRAVAEEVARHLLTYPPGPDGHVFSAPQGGPLEYANFYRRVWRPAVDAAGLAPLRIHDLRHTGVALAIAAGAHPKEIQELCRHRSITTTLNEYGHLFPQLHERLADRLDEAFEAGRVAHREAAADGGVVKRLDGKAP